MPDSPSFEHRKRLAEERLRAGCNPESENGSAIRSDAWCAALGWQDQLQEEAMEAGDEQE